MIPIYDQQIRTPELMFQPALARDDTQPLYEFDNVTGKPTSTADMGIHHTVHETIQMLDCDVQADCYNNIIVSGGSSMYPGLPERLHKEVQALQPHMKAKVIAPPERLISTWIGASIM